jgi:hypothetical protein
LGDFGFGSFFELTSENFLNSELIKLGAAGAGKRWKFSNVSFPTKTYYESNQIDITTRILLSGGGSKRGGCR